MSVGRICTKLLISWTTPCTSWGSTRVKACTRPSSSCVAALINAGSMVAIVWTIVVIMLGNTVATWVITPVKAPTTELIIPGSCADRLLINPTICPETAWIFPVITVMSPPVASSIAPKAATPATAIIHGFAIMVAPSIRKTPARRDTKGINRANRAGKRAISPGSLPKAPLIMLGSLPNTLPKSPGSLPSVDEKMRGILLRAAPVTPGIRAKVVPIRPGIPLKAVLILVEILLNRVAAFSVSPAVLVMAFPASSAPFL